MTSLTINIAEDPAKRKRRTTLLRLAIAAGVSCVVPSCMMIVTQKVAGAIGIMIGMNLIMLGLALLLKFRTAFFVHVDDEKIEWLHLEQNQKKFTEKLTIAWDDIRRIKQESDGSLRIFLDSSFDYSIPFDPFTEADRLTMTRAVAEGAKEKNILLVNFSEQPVLTA